MNTATIHCLNGSGVHSGREGQAEQGGWVREVAEEPEVWSACPGGHLGSFSRDLPWGHGPCPPVVEGPALVLRQLCLSPLGSELQRQGALLDSLLPDPAQAT